MTRVAITGIGLITALGSDRERSWEALVAGQCGIRPVTAFDTEGYRSRIAAEVCMPAIDAALTPLQQAKYRVLEGEVRKKLPADAGTGDDG